MHDAASWAVSRAECVFHEWGCDIHLQQSAQHYTLRRPWPLPQPCPHDMPGCFCPVALTVRQGGQLADGANSGSLPPQCVMYAKATQHWC